MDRTLRNVILSLVGVLVLFFLIIWIGGTIDFQGRADNLASGVLAQVIDIYNCRKVIDV